VIKRAPWQQTQFNKNLVRAKKSTKLDKTNSNTSKHRNKNEKRVALSLAIVQISYHSRTI
jgi:hypothetical protein